MRLLTTSRAKDYRACARPHHVKYELGYRPVVEADVLRFGTLMHFGLEAWFLAGLQGHLAQRLEFALAAIQQHATDPFELARAEAMMVGYDLRWANEPLEVLRVEAQFETELRNPITGAASRTWKLAGKIDVIVRDQSTGEDLVVEHKTSSEDISPASNYWRRLRMDGQVSTYFEGARSLGYNVTRCLYDVLLKPAQKPFKATPIGDRKYTKPTKAEPVPRLYANQREADETPEEFRARVAEAIAEDLDGYFQRGDVVRLEGEMHDARWDTWQIGQQIREAELAHRAPRNPDACDRYGRLCSFFDVCSGAAVLEDRTRFRRSEHVHPELSTQDQPEGQST
jgi:hypothetical protein